MNWAHLSLVVVIFYQLLIDEINASDWNGPYAAGPPPNAYDPNLAPPMYPPVYYDAYGNQIPHQGQNPHQQPYQYPPQQPYAQFSHPQHSEQYELSPELTKHYNILQLADELRKIISKDPAALFVAYEFYLWAEEELPKELRLKYGKSHRNLMNFLPANIVNIIHSILRASDYHLKGRKAKHMPINTGQALAEEGFFTTKGRIYHVLCLKAEAVGLINDDIRTILEQKSNHKPTQDPVKKKKGSAAEKPIDASKITEMTIIGNAIQAKLTDIPQLRYHADTYTCPKQHNQELKEDIYARVVTGVNAHETKEGRLGNQLLLTLPPAHYKYVQLYTSDAGGSGFYKRMKFNDQDHLSLFFAEHRKSTVPKSEPEPAESEYDPRMYAPPAVGYGPNLP